MPGMTVRVQRDDLLQEMLRSNGMYLVTVHNGHLVKVHRVEKAAVWEGVGASAEPAGAAVDDAEAINDALKEAEPVQEEAPRKRARSKTVS